MLMLRKFIVWEQGASTSPNVDTSRLADFGRLDIVCRCVSDAVFLSCAMRDDTLIHAVLDGPPNPPVTVTFDTRSMKDIAETEKSIGEVLRKALKSASGMKTGEKKEVHPGVFVSRSGFEAAVKAEAAGSEVFYLSKKGIDIREAGINLSKDILFVIGGHSGLPKNAEKFLMRFSPCMVSAGPRMVFSSQCITLVHNEIDRRVRKSEKSDVC